MDIQRIHDIQAHDAFVFGWHLISVHIVVTGPILTFGAIPHLTAFPLANSAWLDVQQGTDLGRGLAGFDQFLGLSADVQGE